MRRRTLITVTVGLLAAAATAAVAAVPLSHQSIVNRAAARADAAAQLASLSLPAGATTSAADPSTRNVLTHYPPFGPGQASFDLVDDHRYWRVPGAPQTVIDWIESHAPPGSHSYSQGVAGLPSDQPRVLDETFTFASGPNGIDDRALPVEATSAKGGGTAVRADGQAVWLLAKPPWERIPPAAMVVSVTVTWGVRDRSAPITLTTPATVAALARIVNRAPPVQPATYACPAGGVYDIELAFRASPQSPALASARINIEDGCAFVSIHIGDRQGVALFDGYELATAAFKLGGLAYCDASQLRAGAGRPAYEIGAREYTASLSFHNASRTACTVDGFPRLSMSHSDGRPLRTTVTHQHFHPGFATLIPGASASVFLAWRSACPTESAATLAARLPRITTAFVIPVGSRRHPWDPCRGRLSVGPLSSF